MLYQVYYYKNWVSGFMSNQQIRRQAQSIYAQNIVRFLLVAILFFLPSCFNFIVNSFVEPLSKNLVTLFVLIITYPLKLGIVAYFYREFHNQKCSFHSVVQFYCEKKQLLNTFCLGAVIQVINFLLMHSSALFQAWGKMYPLLVVIVQIIPTILVLIAQFILPFRFFLVPYVFLENTKAKPFRVIKESMRKTKGYMLDQIAFGISIGWIPAFLIIALTLVLVGTSLLAKPLPSLGFIFMLLIIPFMPYIQLCLGGFADRLLPEIQKKKIKIANYKSKSNQKYAYKIDWFE